LALRAAGRETEDFKAERVQRHRKAQRTKQFLSRVKKRARAAGEDEEDAVQKQLYEDLLRADEIVRAEGGPEELDPMQAAEQALRSEEERKRREEEAAIQREIFKREEAERKRREEEAEEADEDQAAEAVADEGDEGTEEGNGGAAGSPGRAAPAPAPATRPASITSSPTGLLEAMDGAGSTEQLPITGGTTLPGCTPMVEPARTKPCIVWQASLAAVSEANSTIAVPQCSFGFVVEGSSSQLRTMPKAWKTMRMSLDSNSRGMRVTTTRRLSINLPVSPPAAAVVAITAARGVFVGPGWPPDWPCEVGFFSSCCCPKLCTSAAGATPRAMRTPGSELRRATLSFWPPSVKSCMLAMATSTPLWTRSAHAITRPALPRNGLRARSLTPRTTVASQAV